MYLLPIVIIVILLVFVLIFFYALSIFPFTIFLKARTSDAYCTPKQLIGMQLRKVPTGLLVAHFIRARQARLNVSLDKIEIHYLSGGNVGNVIDALISAKNANLSLTFERAVAIDLAGRDVSAAVKMSVQPKVIKTANIHGVAKDGIELIIRANVTVRANLETMVGGSGEETIIARIAEGIVSAIGSSESHKVVLNKPDMLAQSVISAGLDSGSAYEIVSLDIADIDVGQNIGAKLKNTQAIADKKVAESRSEGRRALAVAQTEENKAAEEEAIAKLIEAQMRIPLTLASTYRAGRIIVKRKPQKNKQAQLNLGFGDDS